MNDTRHRSQWDSDFICPNCYGWLRIRSAIFDVDAIAEVRLYCGKCCRHHVILIREEDLENESENGRHLHKYFKKPLKVKEVHTDVSAKRKRWKKHTVGSEIYGGVRSEYKSARRIKKKPKGS